MPIRIAMPVAHVVGSPDYGSYYMASGDCIFRASRYFNDAGCRGILLERQPGAPVPLLDSLWDLFAFTDGFLSLQGDTLVLRLPRELTNGAGARHNSGVQFYDVTPRGPQLRHVLYRFTALPPTVRDTIRTILQDAAHPGRQIMRVFRAPLREPVTLQAFLDTGANLELVLDDFMFGRVEVFVRAGDVIGNFRNQSVELQFLDSCGNHTAFPAPPAGRPINPAYFLYLVQAARNAAAVTMLTALVAVAPSAASTHPLNFLLNPARVAAAGHEPQLGIDLAATEPPRPLHITVEVRNAANALIAGYGIPMGALGDWHESRNSASPGTRAPVRWRLYGNQAGDNNAADFGRFITEVKAGQGNLLPGAAVFDHQFTPEAEQTDRAQSYWLRYRHIFNAVASLFQLPVELILATACTETSTGAWYNANFANSHEMDVIRMEPLARAPNDISPQPAQRQLLTHYRDLANPRGANANLPVPWSGAAAVRAGNPLTWQQLRDLIQSYPADVKVSPGIMQTLVGTAMGDLGWGTAFYGAGYVHSLTIVHNGVAITADNPPATRADMFSDWFGVAVDAAGNNTTAAASVHAELTRMKRAFHSIVAGGAHIKHMYNTIYNGSNMITDFDLPTSFCAFNDGGMPAAPAMARDDDDTKWHRLFALLYYDQNYPRTAPRFYNEAVRYFNVTAGLNPRPAVRLWRG